MPVKVPSFTLVKRVYLFPSARSSQPDAIAIAIAAHLNFGCIDAIRPAEDAVGVKGGGGGGAKSLMCAD